MFCIAAWVQCDGATASCAAIRDRHHIMSCVADNSILSGVLHRPVFTWKGSVVDGSKILRFPTPGFLGMFLKRSKATRHAIRCKKRSTSLVDGSTLSPISSSSSCAGGRGGTATRHCAGFCPGSGIVGGSLSIYFSLGMKVSSLGLCWSPQQDYQLRGGAGGLLSCSFLYI